MKNLYFVAVCIFISAVNAKSTSFAADEDDYDLHVSEPEHGIQNDYDYTETEDDDQEPELPDPILTTRPQDFITKEHETVHLPCQIENGDSLVLMWKKNNDLIFQDSIKFTGFGNNFQVVNRTLIISNVGANETANYTCLIPLSKTDSLQVTHRLFVQTAPKIVSLRAQHDILQLDAGKVLVLTCKAIGFPKPTIKWSRKGLRLAEEGETVTIENIGHHDAGDYQCLADNNIEPPAHQYIHIGVAHKPVVKIEKLSVNTDQNLDAQLICYVHAVPKADVIWQYDGLNIVTDKRRVFKNSNHTYILEIKSVQTTDFGVYTCIAENRKGRSEKNVTLIANPSTPEHIRTFHEPDRNTLSWTVESKSPIIKYSLDYKKLSDSKWEVVAPEVSNADGNIYTANYIFENLPAGHYEAKLRARNTYGWSHWSDVVKFKSERHHHKSEHHQKPEQVTIREEVVYQPRPHPLENDVYNAENSVISQTAQAPVVVEGPTEKPHTQEHQHQPAKEGNNHDGASLCLPVIPLLCITLLTTFYGR